MWNNWEAGRNNPSDANQRKLAEFFGITMGELRGESGEKKRPAIPAEPPEITFERLSRACEDVQVALAEFSRQLRRDPTPEKHRLAAQELLGIVEALLETLSNV